MTEVQQVWVVPIGRLLVSEEVVFVEELLHSLLIDFGALNLRRLHDLEGTLPRGSQDLAVLGEQKVLEIGLGLQVRWEYVLF